MATAPNPNQPASAPKATNTSVWNKLFGGGTADSAAREIEKRPSKIDEAEKKAVGYKAGGMVKMTKSSTPHKCK